jgi:hypothetical protein
LESWHGLEISDQCVNASSQSYNCAEPLLHFISLLFSRFGSNSITFMRKWNSIYFTRPFLIPISTAIFTVFLLQLPFLSFLYFFSLVSSIFTFIFSQVSELFFRFPIKCNYQRRFSRPFSLRVSSFLSFMPTSKCRVPLHFVQNFLSPMDPIPISR